MFNELTEIERLIIINVILDSVKQFIYLQFSFDKKESFKPTLNDLSKKDTNATSALKRIMNFNYLSTKAS